MTNLSKMPTQPSRKVLIALAAAAFVALIAGCAGTPSQESTGEYLDNSLITAKVKTALLSAENLRSGQISVASFKGKVQLSGFVATEADKRQAEVIARDVDGVKSVTNGIEVKGQ
jgi:osmotically-inducible protein OsmY